MELRLGDCLDVLRTLPEGSVDAVVTDPPAGIGFMGKKWDTPGALVERAAGTCVEWDQAGGNHHPCSQADTVRTRRSEGAKFREFLTPRLAEALRVARPGAVMLCWAIPRTSHWTGTAIEDAGWLIEDRIAHLFGTGFPKHKSKLKPACEDWWLARKPGPKWLGVDACRIPTIAGESLDGGRVSTTTEGWDRPWKHDPEAIAACRERGRAAVEKAETLGRWPANVVLDEEAARLLDEQSGERGGGFGVRGSDQNGVAAAQGINKYHRVNRKDLGAVVGYGDSGGASRFYYCAKASKSDRGENNKHPTVKSTNLMRWLCRLACPPGGVILDPFAGSGSTGKAAIHEGFSFVGIERDPESFATAQRRIAAAQRDAAERLALA